MNALLFILAITLGADLETDNVAKYQGDAYFSYSGRVAILSWCHPETAATYDLQVVDIVGEFNVVEETGLTSTTYMWTIPRSGSYMVRLRAHYPDGGVSDWNESVTNGSVVTSGCELKRSFILNAIIAPPTGGGVFE